MVALRKLIATRGWSQAQAAKVLGVTQSRVSDLVRGKHEKFSLDMLVIFAARAGRTVKLRLAA
jgi:predicted XRE-type DNA-binding protein